MKTSKSKTTNKVSQKMTEIAEIIHSSEVTTNLLNINNMEAITTTQVQGGKSQSQAIGLAYEVKHGNRNRERQSQITKVTNKTAFDRFTKLCLAEYYLRIYPYMHQQTGECYFWIFGVKKSSQTFDFKLKVNNEILNVVMGYISTGTLIDTSKIEADNIKEFNDNISNFSLALYQGEIAQGQRKVRHVSNKSYSKYDFGMIIYDTTKNEQMKEFINSTIL